MRSYLVFVMRGSEMVRPYLIKAPNAPEAKGEAAKLPLEPGESMVITRMEKDKTYAPRNIKPFREG